MYTALFFLCFAALALAAPSPKGKRLFYKLNCFGAVFY
jgi:hypothetical protein